MKKETNLTVFLLCCGLGSFVFFFFPDIDISVLSIKYHRFFLTHSVIIPLLFFIALSRVRQKIINSVLVLLLAGFTSGITVHLATDIFPRKTINFLIVNTLVKGTYWDDRLWIIGNMFLGAYIIYRLFLVFRKTAE